MDDWNPPPKFGMGSPPVGIPAEDALNGLADPPPVIWGRRPTPSDCPNLESPGPPPAPGVEPNPPVAPVGWLFRKLRPPPAVDPFAGPLPGGEDRKLGDDPVPAADGELNPFGAGSPVIAGV